MKKDDAIMLAIVALVVLLRRKIEWGTGWVWPVPSMKWRGRIYPAVISQESHDGHNGVDIMYRRRLDDGSLPEFPPGTSGGSPHHFAPLSVPVVAARDGQVWSVDKSPRGCEVVINHGKPFATYYQHLSSTVLGPHKRGVSTLTGQPTTVRAGQPIGIMGGDPIEPTHLRHLHFEVWHEGGADHAVSPDDAMQSWSRPPLLFTP